MNALMQRLNGNPIFRFISSVRLAVPLMLLLGVVVAIGTILESRYNAQVASIWVYRAPYFLVLLGLLWLNIFCATISRIPFKKHHTGFVITHIGLLSLLVGAVFTSVSGVDGQLRVVEGKTGNTVVLPDLAIRIAGDGMPARSFRMKRKLNEMEGSSFVSLPQELGFVVEKYVPFVTREPGVETVKPDSPDLARAGTALQFRIKSAFFDVTETLHSKERPELQMGPAKIRLRSAQVATPKLAKAPAPKKTRPARTSNAPVLVILDSGSGAELSRTPIAALRKATVRAKGATITLVRAFEDAIVADKKLVDRGTPGANPALELKIDGEGSGAREIVFARHPEFALNAGGALGLRFKYERGGMPEEQAAPAMAESPHAGGLDRSGNVVEFTPTEQGVQVELFKNGEKVLSQKLATGQEVTTPWMGMRLTLLEAKSNAVLVDRVKPISLPERTQLPPSAIFVRSAGGSMADGVWVGEGEFKALRTESGVRELYYGPDELELPFMVQLDRFTKTDYPGTSTPMAYESLVRMNGTGTPVTISMNEPLTFDGYTLYQSSYEMGQGMETASIFSVNKDPGRSIKYIGSIILCLGIVIYTLMKSRLYRSKRAGSAAMLALLIGAAMAAQPARAETPAENPAPAAGAIGLDAVTAQARFLTAARAIDSSAIATLPVQSHGRIKPLQTFAREAVLFLTGKYSLWGLDSVQLYLGLVISDTASSLEVVNLRDPALRTEIGLSKEKRLFSVNELSTTRLEALARPALDKQEQNSRSLSPREKSLVEAAEQMWLLRGIASGEHLFMALNLNPVPGGAAGHGGAQNEAMVLQGKAQNYLRSLMSGDAMNSSLLAKDFVETAKSQPVPQLFRRYMNHLDLEVAFNRVRLFFWAGIIYLLLGIFLCSRLAEGKMTKKAVLGILVLPFLAHIAGFAIRVLITGFAPVTNMYGTMVWMSFGVVLFGGILYALYSSRVVYGILLIGSGLTLLLTESIPLVLSPDLDPVVAVLRNNFWLTIHVLTISISYAAFTISMLIGNVVLIRSVLSTFVPGVTALTDKQITQYSHLVHRVIQLGVFLLTAGIILGGVWADYSWGRFWGWDPKETWALIADLGYLTILHGRFAGWVSPFGILSASPAAYLLVIMAWYGVNFILAAGLHSYGFSSGGVTAVAIFVTIQLLLLAAGLIAHRARKGGRNLAAT